MAGIKVDDSEKEAIIKKGVREGSSLCPVLVNLFIENDEVKKYRCVITVSVKSRTTVKVELKFMVKIIKCCDLWKILFC